MKYDHLIGAGFDRWSSGEYTPGQIEAFNNFKDPFVLLSGSYRSGKTEIMARAVVRHALVFSGAKGGVFRAHLTSLKKSTLPTVLELVHPSWVEDWSNTDLVLRLINGSVISFIGADFPDRLGSIELTMAAIDEASEVTEEAITMIQGRLSGKLETPSNLDELPENLREYALGSISVRQVWMACNPKSTSHTLYDRFFKNPRPGHKVYTSNSIANTNLPVNYLVQNLSAYVRSPQSMDWVVEQIELIRKGQRDPNGLHLKEYLTPIGQRNLLGLWVALEGAVYSFDESRHMVDERPVDWLPTGLSYAGVDFGYHNPRAILLEQHRNSKGDTCYLATRYWQKPESTSDDLIAALREMNPDKMILPHDRPDIFKLCRAEFGASYLKRAKTQVFDGINTVSRFLNNDWLKFMRAPGYEVCIDEVTGYEWSKTKDGQYLDAPVKAKDHYPDAIRYALHTFHSKDTGYVEEESY
jgi:phage terminase large subunit